MQKITVLSMGIVLFTATAFTAGPEDKFRLLDDSVATSKTPPTLKKKGKWEVLFDGTSTEHWRGFRKNYLPPGMDN